MKPRTLAAPLSAIPIGFKVCEVHDVPAEALNEFADVVAKATKNDVENADLKAAYVRLVCAMIQAPVSERLVSAWFSSALGALVFREWERQMYTATEVGAIGGRA